MKQILTTADRTATIARSKADRAIIRATFSADTIAIDRPWADELDAIENAKRERSMRDLGFGQRASYCG